MDNSLENKYKEEIASLKKRLYKLEDDYSEALANADLAIVETKPDMRILNSDGAIDSIFEEGIKYFERGENLLKVIVKTTHNNRPTVDNVYQQSDEVHTIEDTIRKFVEGSLEEKTIRIVGEKQSGEIFLLLWKIKRKGDKFKSFFRIIPTNQIISAAQDKHKAEIAYMNKLVRDTLNLAEEGVVITNMKNEVMYINNAARKFFLSSASNLLKNAPIEGRHFSDMMVNDSSDEVKLAMDRLQECATTHKPTSYVKRNGDSKVLYKLYPLFNEKRHIIGVITLLRDDADIFGTSSNQKSDIDKLSKALKHYHALSKKLEIRNAELENNQKWLMKQSGEYQTAMRSLLAILENLPMPVAVLQLPSRKYDFVNKAFIAKFKVNKEEIKSKSDFDLMPIEDAELFDAKNVETMETRGVVKVSSPNYYAKQTSLVNSSNQATHIIRVYN